MVKQPNIVNRTITNISVRLAGGGLLLILGILLVGAWVSGSPVPGSRVPGGPGVAPLAAIGFLLLGLGTLASAARARGLTAAFGGMLLTLAGLAVYRPDSAGPALLEILVRDIGLPPGGVLAPDATASLVLGAILLLVIGTRRRSPVRDWLTGTLSVTILVLAIMGFVAGEVGVQAWYQLSWSRPMLPAHALGLVLFALSFVVSVLVTDLRSARSSPMLPVLLALGVSIGTLQVAVAAYRGDVARATSELDTRAEEAGIELARAFEYRMGWLRSLALRTLQAGTGAASPDFATIVAGGAADAALLDIHYFDNQGSLLGSFSSPGHGGGPQHAELLARSIVTADPGSGVEPVSYQVMPHPGQPGRYLFVASQLVRVSGEERSMIHACWDLSSIIRAAVARRLSGEYAVDVELDGGLVFDAGERSAKSTASEIDIFPLGLDGRLRLYRDSGQLFRGAVARTSFVLLLGLLVAGVLGLLAYFSQKLAREKQQVLAANRDLEREIRKQQRTEKALVAARHEAEAASRAKSEFLAVMSHEIRTPMNGVLGMASMLAGTRLDAEQREQLRVIRSSGESLLGILNDILDFSKLEAGQMQVECRDFAVAECVGEVAALFRQQSEARGVRMDYRIDDEVPPVVTGDPARLRQVLLNLVGNAHKFTREGQIRIDVRPARRRSATDEHLLLHFSVNDTGPGIPEAKQSILFKQFTQADASTTRKYGGTGLGLAISRELVTLMGGRIWVESVVGVGSTFHFEIEVGRGASNAKPVVAAESPHPGEAPELDLPPMRILVAEDNTVNQLLIRKMLARLGYRPHFAADGVEAVEAARNGDYDLILMDIQMPHMDGVEATRQIRSAGTGSVPVIVALTANVMAEEQAAYLAAGMDAVLAKPYSFYDIRTLLLRVAGKQAAPAGDPAARAC